MTLQSVGICTQRAYCLRLPLLVISIWSLAACSCKRIQNNPLEGSGGGRQTVSLILDRLHIADCKTWAADDIAPQPITTTISNQDIGNRPLHRLSVDTSAVLARPVTR